MSLAVARTIDSAAFSRLSQIRESMQDQALGEVHCTLWRIGSDAESPPSWIVLVGASAKHKPEMGIIRQILSTSCKCRSVLLPTDEGPSYLGKRGRPFLRGQRMIGTA